MDILQYSAKSQIWGFSIERTAKRMKQVFQRMLKAGDTGITVDQWVILQLLKEEDGVSQLYIAAETNKDAPTVTRIIDLLCKKNLCVRKPNEQDRRKFSICLTQGGKDKIKEVLPIVKKFRMRGWEGLKEKDLNQLMRTLDIIYNNLEE